METETIVALYGLSAVLIFGDSAIGLTLAGLTFAITTFLAFRKIRKEKRSECTSNFDEPILASFTATRGASKTVEDVAVEFGITLTEANASLERLRVAGKITLSGRTGRRYTVPLR